MIAVASVVEYKKKPIKHVMGFFSVKEEIIRTFQSELTSR